MKEKITKNGIDYVLVGDYYIPDLKLSEEEYLIGKYGRMHREYLKKIIWCYLLICYGAVSSGHILRI